MFRAGRRKKQFLSHEATEAILRRGLAGVLGVHGDDGYPYAVPISYVYEGGKIYLHSANSGHKLDSIRRDDKISFCVIDQDQVMPEELTTYFRSAIVFGRARTIEEPEVKRHALELLGQKYSAAFPEKIAASIAREWSAVTVVEIVVDHMSGKEAIELVAMREKVLPSTNDSNE